MVASVPDHFDMDDADELPEAESSERDSKEVRCKYCRERDLFWRNTGKGFVLVDGEGRTHRCPNRKPSTNDFEVIE